MIKKEEIALKRNNDFILDNLDYQILMMLYKPIIGEDALDFYFSLYQISYGIKSTTRTIVFVKDVISNDSITNEDLNNYKEILQNVKLIKLITLNNIELFPCYDKKEFFESALGSYLKSSISRAHFMYLTSRFYKEDKEINESSDFGLDKLSLKIDYKTRKKDTIPFSFDEFRDAAYESGHNVDVHDRFFFESISSIYSLSLENMLTILFEVSDENNNYSKDDIIENSYNKFSIKREKENKKNKLSKTDLELVEYFDGIKPEEVLSSKIKNISRSDLSIIDRLRGTLGLTEGEISLLLAYCLAINDNKLKPYNYFEKVATDWKNNNIENTLDAFYYISRYYEKKDKPKQYKEKETTEEWFDNYWDQIVGKKEENK